MIHLIYAKQYSIFKNLYYRFIVKFAALKASRIITVSENSKKDISRFLKIPDKKINPICNGVGERFFQRKSEIFKKETLKKLMVPEKYILYVGNEKPHKNVGNVIKAFHLFLEKYGLEYSLVIVGISPKYEEKVMGKTLSNNVITLSHVDDSDLISLYQTTLLLLSPSLYEGFGLPLLEAMACGAPVITSSNSSISEVVGNAALFVDPKNINQISDEIRRVLSDEKLREELIKKGKNRARLFTWQNTAQKTLELYKEVYISGRPLSSLP